MCAFPSADWKLIDSIIAKEILLGTEWNANETCKKCQGYIYSIMQVSLHYNTSALLETIFSCDENKLVGNLLFWFSIRM